MCHPVTFKNVSPRAFRAIVARIRAQAEATEETGGTGTASGAGFAARWTYESKDGTLLIQCTRKPWYVAESLVEGKIRSLVESVKV
jgi:hypothetical protein